MKTRAVSEAISTGNTRVEKPKLSGDQRIEQRCIDALGKCKNFWVRKSVNNDSIKVSVSDGKIFIGGTVDSQISRESALEAIRNWQKKTRNKMEVVDKLAIDSNSVEEQVKISQKYLTDPGIIEGVELDEEMPEVIDPRSFDY